MKFLTVWMGMLEKEEGELKEQIGSRGDVLVKELYVEKMDRVKRELENIYSKFAF